MNISDSKYDMNDNAKNLEDQNRTSNFQNNFSEENSESVKEEDVELSKIKIKLSEKKKGDSMDLK